jgi:hypothetical protein
MSEFTQGDTPEVNSGQTIADQTEATPPKESVEMSPTALQNELEREKARAATALREQDRLRKELRSVRQRRVDDTQTETDGYTHSETLNPNGSIGINRSEMERGIYKMVLENPEFKEILEYKVSLVSKEFKAQMVLKE